MKRLDLSEQHQHNQGTNQVAGTRQGGLKAAESNYERHGKDFYRGIGAKGGAISRGGGFSPEHVYEDGLTGREKARIAGAKGGSASRRVKSDARD